MGERLAPDRSETWYEGLLHRHTENKLGLEPGSLPEDANFWPDSAKVFATAMLVESLPSSSDDTQAQDDLARIAKEIRRREKRGDWKTP